jgi:hypothetical protein
VPDRVNAAVQAMESSGRGSMGDRALGESELTAQLPHRDDPVLASSHLPKRTIPVRQSFRLHNGRKVCRTPGFAPRDRCAAVLSAR